MSDRITADRLIREEVNFTWEGINTRATNNLNRRGVSNPTKKEIHQEIINSSKRSRKSVNDKLGVK